jgi:hypothetical protein
MMTIIIFWALVLVSLKLLVAIIIDAFRPLPKPTGKRKSRKSPFLDPISVAMMAMAKGRGVEDLLEAPWVQAVSESLTPREVSFAQRLHKKRQYFAGCLIEEHFYYKSRAKTALVKMLDIPRERCLFQTNPYLLDWAGMKISLAIATGSSKYLATQFAYFNDRADHYLWLVPMNRDFTSWQVRGAMSDRDFSLLFERGHIRVTSSGYAQVPKELFNNPRAWYSQVLSSGVNK